MCGASQPDPYTVQNHILVNNVANVKRLQDSLVVRLCGKSSYIVALFSVAWINANTRWLNALACSIMGTWPHASMTHVLV